MSRTSFTTVVPGFLSLAVAVALALPLAAQDWSQKLFQEFSHDFGTVVRGSKVEYRFQMQNVFEENVEIQGVRTSCRCAEVTFTQKTLKTWETAEIVVRLNTLQFDGPRNANITVVLAKPRYAEVQLKVKAVIRSDMLIQPGAIEFGTGSVENLKPQTIMIRRFGNRHWRIVDVRSAYTDVGVTLNEVHRGMDRVEYALRVRIKETAAPGLAQGELIVVANDGQQEVRFPIQFTGKVNAHLEISPQVLDFEVVRIGEEVTKKIVLRGVQEFSVVSSETESDALIVSCGKERKKVHVVEITCRGLHQPGRHELRIRFVTDMNGGESVQLPVTVTVAESTSRSNLENVRE